MNLKNSEHSTDNETESVTAQDWFKDEAFWRTFGPLMFGPDQFSEAEQQVEDLLTLLDIRQPESAVLRILDLGCGPGRHALPLARRGHQVTAVDTSAFLLDQLRQSTETEQLSIDIIQQDMREFRQPDQFDLAIVMWTSFGYFEDEADHRKVLNNQFNNLRSGGRLVLDLVGLEYLCRSLEPVHWTEHRHGRILIERPVLTHDLTRLENEWILVQSDGRGGERIHRRLFSHRIWSAGEIRHWLQDAGFEPVSICGDWLGNEYAIESERQIAVAAKP